MFYSKTDIVKYKHEAPVFDAKGKALLVSISFSKTKEGCGKILPNGVAFGNLTQPDIDLMMSHIDSYSRKKLSDKSPLEMFNFIYGEEISKKLGQVKSHLMKYCSNPLF